MFDGVFEDAARLDGPGIVGVRVAQLPASEVFAIEQGLKILFIVTGDQGQRGRG
jgi:hypothetical protein